MGALLDDDDDDIWGTAYTRVRLVVELLRGTRVTRDGQQVTK